MIDVWIECKVGHVEVVRNSWMTGVLKRVGVCLDLRDGKI